MPLIAGTPFIQMVRNYRMAWFMGRMGGGKTSLAYYVASILLSKFGYRYLVSNCGSPWNDRLEDIELRENAKGYPQYADTVMILDEGGVFLEYGKDAREFTGFLRKMNIVILLSSYSEVARELRNVQVQRLMNLQTLGLPVWEYEYRLSYGGQRDKAKFFWRNPYEIFGVYDTDGMPIDDCGISVWLSDQKNLLVEREKRNQTADGRRGEYAARKLSLPTVEGFGREFEQVNDAAATIEQSVSLLTDRIDKRRR